MTRLVIASIICTIWLSLAPTASAHHLDDPSWDETVFSSRNVFKCDSFRILVNTIDRRISPVIGSCSLLRDGDYEAAHLQVERVDNGSVVQVLRSSGIGAGQVVYSFTTAISSYYDWWQYSLRCGTYRVALEGAVAGYPRSELVRMTSNQFRLPCTSLDSSSSESSPTIPAPYSIRYRTTPTGLVVSWRGNPGVFEVVAKRIAGDGKVLPASRRACFGYLSQLGRSHCTIRGVTSGKWKVWIKRTFGGSTSTRNLTVSL